MDSSFENYDDDLGHSIDVAFGKWIIEKRNAIQMSSREAANRAGMDLIRWREIESGAPFKAVMDFECIRIAHGIGVDVAIVRKKAVGE